MGLDCEESGEQHFGEATHVDGVVDLPGGDGPEQSFVVDAFERLIAQEHLVKYDPRSPDITLMRVRTPPVGLRTHIQR